ncbi:MAG: VCBS repeat-containing protein [Gemmataceae bacterium]|nr:VCBS repeat-containing protein [Gemmataceae bacterium]
MNLSRTLALLVGVVLLGALADPGRAYVEERFTLPRVINESTHILVVQVEKVNKERKLIYYKKVADLKGKHPTDVIKHNLSVGGFNEKEKKLPIEWAEPGKLAIIFHNGGASETCIGTYWYQAYSGGDWWNHSHGEPYLCRTFCGEVKELRQAVEKLLRNEDVIVPATVSKTDLRIQKVRASMKTPMAYVVAEAPAITATLLKGVAGFSDMIQLPRPEGVIQGAIPVDVDGDGQLDLLLVGRGSLLLLRNNGKGGFDDVTDKWGLSKDPGCLAAAFADYNRSGRLSLLTSTGRLYTNLGTKFKDDSALLPPTPERVNNPGEAFAWADINGDGLPDVICSVGADGLAAFLNTGGKGGKWFEDASDKVGLGAEGIGTEPSNFLTVVDLDGDGRPDFVLNLSEPLVALNRDGVFKAARDTGLSFPALPRPSVACADFLNDGRPGVFVTTSERAGAITDWHMIGTFSAEEDRKLAAKPDFSPDTRTEVKIGGERWDWRSVQARANGLLEIRRSQPSPNAAYAHATFEWARDEKIALYFGSENGLTAWLNGKQVYEHKGKRTYAPDVDRVEVEAKKGANAILLKMFDEGPLWRTSVRPGPATLYPPPSVRLFANDGKGKFSDVTLQAGDLAQLRADSVSAVWGDLNNDGLLDLVVTCKTGLVRVYLNEGAGKFRYSTAELALEQKFKASDVVLADFNKDGLLDLLLIGAGEEPCVVLTSKLKSKHTPVTLRFGGPRSAIGARVEVADGAGKLLGTRHISGGDGRNLQAAPEARFALPPGKYQLRVRYSSGEMVTRAITVADRPVWETLTK